MIALLFIWNLMAQDVLVQGPKASDIEFEKRLMENPNWLSYSQYFQNKDRVAHEKLMNDFKQAQFEFLKGSLEKAKTLFQSIGQRQHASLWPVELQKVIHYSLLRAAQLDQKNSRSWLKQALLFGPKLVVDRQLFPPPLVESYEKLKRQTPLQVWALPGDAKQFQTLLINGRPQQPGAKFFRYRNGTVRLDFISDRWQPIKITTALDKLEGLKLQTKPIAQGQCHAPKYLVPAPALGQFRFFNGHCLSHRSTAQVDASLPPQKISHNKDRSRGSRWYKNKWLWMGVSLVATGLAVNSLNQKNRDGSSSGASNTPEEFSNN